MQSMICEAGAMGGPVYIDTVCETMRATEAGPALKAWFKERCPQGQASSSPICKELDPFIRDVAANNRFWREHCGATSGGAARNIAKGER
jgi:hypothetical protein